VGCLFESDPKFLLKRKMSDRGYFIRGHLRERFNDRIIVNQLQLQEVFLYSCRYYYKKLAFINNFLFEHRLSNFYKRFILVKENVKALHLTKK
jgi:DNA-binding transcriptional regulator of glucitol operon